MRPDRLGIRWTIGDVAPEGWTALRLSVWGARRAFGPLARYAICLDAVPLEEAKRRIGELPAGCVWREVTRSAPARKLAPLRLFEDGYELALDNDCILWSVPPAVRRWLDADDGATLLAADVRASYGAFAPWCPLAPRHAGLCGMPPGFDPEEAMRAVLVAYGRPIVSELDEQGLQIAALTRGRRSEVVPLTDLTICSPLPPHLPDLGRNGAYFCGLNSRDLGYLVEGRPASSLVRAHWNRHRAALHARVRLPLPASAAPDARADAR
jgi:hypothetical protein